MPWCEPCGRFYQPETMADDGACPAGHGPESGPEGTAGETGAPWHFKLMLVALAVYLGWRLLEGVGWLANNLLG